MSTSKPTFPSRLLPNASLLALQILLCTVVLTSVSPAGAQEISGSFQANGHEVELAHVIAIEIDSETEPGYLDILVMLSDRELTEDQVRDKEALEKLAFKGGMSGLRLVLDPDCKVKEISPYHPSFKVFLVNADEATWEPSAFDEDVAGRIKASQSAFEQSWAYDLEFRAKIQLDPEATTVNGK